MNLNYPETAGRYLERTRDNKKKRKFVLCNIVFLPHLLKGKNPSLENFRISKDQFVKTTDQHLVKSGNHLFSLLPLVGNPHSFIQLLNMLNPYFNINSFFPCSLEIFKTAWLDVDL